MALSLLPTGISVLAGGVDGLLRQNDANNGRTMIHQQYSTYYEGGLLVLGGVMGMFDVHPDLFEPFLYGGGFGIASKGGQWAMEQASPKATTTTTTGTGTGAAATGGGRGPGGGSALGNPGINYGAYRDEPAGVL
ncbi:MAG TPA: hypothetical protein VMV23_09395 [Candidatus Nanopelagicaceae bacterium]|nr:hypothetical protein [Candidatus Nanopelagicaceae bacterium]